MLFLRSFNRHYSKGGPLRNFLCGIIVSIIGPGWHQLAARPIQGPVLMLASLDFKLLKVVIGT